MNLGFIGLGVMGRAMALNLIRGGHTLAVYARRAEAMRPLTDAGAGACASPREVAERSEVVFTMVTDTAAVEEVVLGAQGVIHGARPGSVVVDMGTVSPAATRRIAARLGERGIEMIDAPVSGGEAGARAGTLSIMAGGKEEAFERVRPLLELLGKTVVHIGGNGAGQIAKACNQLCIVVNQMGVAEAVLLAERNGVDPLRVKDALMGGFAASRILELQAPKMAARDFAGRIESRLHYKDIRIVLELAQELGIDLPASKLAAEMLGRLQEMGGAKEDTAAVFKVLEAMASRAA